MRTHNQVRTDSTNTKRGPGHSQMPAEWSKPTGYTARKKEASCWLVNKVFQCDFGITRFDNGREGRLIYLRRGKV